MPCCRSLAWITNVGFQQSSLGARHLANQIIEVGNIASSEPDVSAISRLLGGSSTFILEGKGPQARVWYKVMCRWYSIVFLENASFWFVLASSRRDPFVPPIHGMSYPRGDTFLTRRFSMSEKRRRCIHTHSLSLSAPDRRHNRDDEDRFHYGMAGKHMYDIYRYDMEEI